MRRIDIHPHVVSPDTGRYPLAPLGGKRSDWSKSAHSLTPAELVAAMDAAGVDRAAIVHSSTTYGYDNRLVIDAVAEFPDRFTAVCSIDALQPDAVATLQALVAQGCTGIRFFTTGSTMPGQADWLNDPRSYPVWQYCQDNGLPICAQVSPKGLGMLRDMMDRFPGVAIVLDHVGRPDLSSGPPYPDAQGALDLAAAYPQVTVKITPAVLRMCSEGQASAETFLPMVVAAYGADRIAWGSNYPASSGSLSEIAEACESALSFLSADDLAKVMGGNALRLYPALAR